MSFSGSSTFLNVAVPFLTSAVYVLPSTVNAAVPFLTGLPFSSSIVMVMSVFSPAFPLMSSADGALVFTFLTLAYYNE